MDKIKETYETASWIFRESITLDDFRKVIKNLKPSDNNDFKAHKSSPKVCFKCAGENMMKPITDIDTPCERHKSKSS